MLNLGGTYREISAEETLERIKPMLGEKFGITRVANITGLDNIGINTVVAIRPNAKSLSNSQGKGLSLPLATASALMESIEIWHGENLPAAELLGSYQQLRYLYPLFPIETLQSALFSSRLLQLDLAWVGATNLVSSAACYLPRSLFNQDRSQMESNAALFWPTTNGLASGNSLEEASCHALFEVIERDCVMKNTMQNKAKLIDLNHLPSTACENLVGRLQQDHYQLIIHDIRDELDIPCYQALIDDSRDLRNIGVFGGYGCHFSDEIALLRALTEAAQSRLTYIAGARDDIDSHFYQAKQEKIRAHGQGTYRPDYQNSVPKTMKDCLSLLVDRLYLHGHKDIYVYDLTQKTIGISVVQVIVPGLRFAPSGFLFKPDQRL